MCTDHLVPFYIIIAIFLPVTCVQYETDEGRTVNFMNYSLATLNDRFIRYARLSRLADRHQFYSKPSFYFNHSLRFMKRNLKYVSFD